MMTSRSSTLLQAVLVAIALVHLVAAVPGTVHLRTANDVARSFRGFNATHNLQGGAYGADVSSCVSRAQFECLRSNYGVSFVIVRCWEQVGHGDSCCPSTVANAWDAGLSHVDLYHFPSPHIDPVTQARDAASFVHGNGIRFGQYWIDVEPFGGGWGLGHDGNARFIASLVEGARSAGLGSVGVYTNWNSWSEITGNSGILGGGVPLWYPDWDEAADFNDFRSFGGWGRPNMKQFRGDHVECGVDFDANWYP